MKYDYSIYYKRFHENTEEHAVKMAEWIRIYLRDILPTNRATQILDVGCGVGYALRAMKAEGFTKLHGVEISDDQAKIARDAGFSVSVVDDTVKFLQQVGTRFGVVLLLDVLEHIPVASQIDFLRAIKEVLEPGGRLILTVPNANSPLSARWRYNDYTHCSSFTEHSLFFVLRNAGFMNIEIDCSKGIGKFPLKWWHLEKRSEVRKWLVRFAWLQVFKAELHPNEDLNDICFELNLKAIASSDAV